MIAVYLVAGISSRFDGKIKQLVKVTEKDSLIEYSVKQAIKAGFSKIIFIVGDKTEIPFKELFGDNFMGVPVLYAKQEFDIKKRGRPWGTVDALCSAKELIDSNFVVCNGDDIYGENSYKILLNHLKNEVECATIGYKLGDVLSEEGGVNRGVFRTSGGYVLDLKEYYNIQKYKLGDLNWSNLCSMNIFALQKEVVGLLLGMLVKFKKENEGDRTRECLFPDVIPKLIEKGIKMRVYPTPDKWYGITNPGDEKIIRKALI